MGVRTWGRVVVTLALAAGAMLACAAIQGCSGAGTVAKSTADRLLPVPSRMVWARCPAPGAHVDSYPDASGSGVNFVYDVEAAAEDGTRLMVTIILFGREASGQGWLRIEAKGSSGVRYDGVDESEVPQTAHDVLGAG